MREREYSWLPSWSGSVAKIYLFFVLSFGITGILAIFLGFPSFADLLVNFLGLFLVRVGIGILGLVALTIIVESLRA